jgi:acyl-CoA thioester hydrolase
MQGVVFDSHYLAYVDVAITELWRAAFGSYDTMLDREVDVVVAEAQLRFHHPAKFDDELILNVLVTHLGTTSIITNHRICHGEELFVDCTIRHVLVDRETLRKKEIPDWMRRQLSPWMAEASHPAAGAPQRAPG